MTSSVKWNMKGVLLDITGVLYESGQKIAIPGSVEAIQRLYSLKVPFRFVTNETQRTRASLVSKLRSFGFTLSESDVFSPGVAASHYVKQMQLRPFLLVHPNILPEFSDCNQSNPNCVVVGDAAEHFSFENMNKAFNILIKSKNPVLISMGKGRYYKENDELVMDLGGFTAALEYATGAEAKIIGKPSPEFFTDALKDMGVNPKEAVMVGDDIMSDVRAAQECGLKGVLVKTGKFRRHSATQLLTQEEDQFPLWHCSTLFFDVLDFVNSV
ncbi:phospholysine phosphohistidine inorganic pyrophosphate phosphatase-like isoform X2 [Stegodyphus dumicola]|nr:phospholysine phosphohistidine inorganic pyrophosphate phosphatase-like isoform X2 [Stegodyphus dumicola]XP_035216911.1 phospholysine phosphohistidine inorganic pyrophosphate phosphatase-like isoform X2 [Stegodyphus dumicola]